MTIRDITTRLVIKLLTVITITNPELLVLVRLHHYPTTHCFHYAPLLIREVTTDTSYLGYYLLCFGLS